MIKKSFKQKTIVSMKSVDFFIPLPDPLNIPDGYAVPMIEVDDGTHSHGVRFKDANGLNKIHTAQFVFHQIPRTITATATQAAFDVFSNNLAQEKPRLEKEPRFYEGKTTVVQYASIRRFKAIDQDLLTDIFDEAVENIRNYQKAYFISTKIPIDLLTRQSIGFAVPYIVSSQSEDGKYLENSPVEEGVFLTNQMRPISVIKNALNSAKLVEIQEANNNNMGNLFDNFSNIRREMYVAYDKGNTLVSGILLGIAAETFLDEILRLLLWEEGVLPIDAHELLQNKFYDTTFKRTESDLYSSRLGGQWNTAVKNSAIRAWRYRILELRNKIAHIGYEPSQKEMQDGFDALSNLIEFVCDRVCENITKYTVACSLVIGYDGMVRRSVIQKFNDYVKDVEVPSNPHNTFGNWKFEVERLSGNEPFKGSYKKSITHLMVCGNGSLVWLVIDLDKRLVMRIPDQAIEDKILKTNINQVISEIRLKRTGTNTLIKIMDLRPKFKRSQQASWSPLYTVSDLMKINRWPVSYLAPDELYIS